jgi:hypothetical protein
VTALIVPNPNPRDAGRIHKLRAVARLLDESIPLPGGFRIGLDPIIGLVPGLGDVISAGFSFIVIVQALRLRAPVSVLIRMLWNVLLDTLIGSIPVAGDLFDAAYKANTRNVELVSRYHIDPSTTHQTSRILVFTVSIFLLLLLLAIVALPVVLIVTITKMF